MESYDISHLPQPVHDAVLHVLATLVQAFPVAAAAPVQTAGPSAGGPDRFPRSAIELLVLEALEALAPMAATPVQVAAMIQRNHLEVRIILQALAMLETIAHPRKGYYARYALPADQSLSTVQGNAKHYNARHGPPAGSSADFAAQIAALCAPRTHREPTKE